VSNATRIVAHWLLASFGQFTTLTPVLQGQTLGKFVHIVFV